MTASQKNSAERRELNYYILLSSIVLLVLLLLASAIWYLRPIPIDTYELSVGPLDQFPPSDTPYRIDSADAWLVNIDGTLLAYPRQLPQPNGASSCRYAWNSANERFEDPCSGSAFRLDGVALRIPTITNQNEIHRPRLRRGKI